MKRLLVSLVIAALPFVIGCSKDEAKTGYAVIKAADGNYYRADDLKKFADANVAPDASKAVNDQLTQQGENVVRGIYGTGYGYGYNYYYTQPTYQNYYYSYNPYYYPQNNFCSGWGYSYSWCNTYLYGTNYNASNYTSYYNNSAYNCGYYGYTYTGNLYGTYPSCFSYTPWGFY
jgi:hypothetical protein